MKNIIPCFLFIFLFPFSAFSQEQNLPSFKKVDAYAGSVKSMNDPGALSRKLTSPYHTDLEKVRVIFRWITENIAYDTKEYHLNPSGDTYTKLYDKIDPGAKNYEGLYRVELSKYVLKCKKAICEGYAVLFKTLCDSSGIKAEIVHGKAKNSISQIGSVFEENHAWSAVFLDNKWQLLDACWASGSCDDSVNIFKKEFDESYFLTPPAKLILNHYPTDKKWCLITNIPSETQFYSYPLIYSGYFQNNISSFLPLNGVIEGKIGNKIIFELKKPDADVSLSVATKKGSNEIKIRKQEKTISYEYIVGSDKDDELTIYYNHTAVFTYRIIVVP